ncbi:5-oxoprolinase subunit PxpB [Psychromonas sp. MME2]|uniref:5-oxoprolinase subunit PxpB n=1 Tax=Psychromonas sp. MME2 TaxID=3231033 RepID=UPI00339CA184
MTTISPVNENCFLIQLAPQIDLSLIDQIAYWVTQIELQLGAALLDITPSYTTILVEYDLLQVSPLDVAKQLEAIIALAPCEVQGKEETHLIELPVFYDVSVGWDLDALSQRTNLTVAEIIQLHSETIYRVCAIGFAPGFAFLAEVPAAIQAPRHATPRHFVPAGSVAIADAQTAVYPSDSPGGWQIIGNCPITLFDHHRDPITPFKVGDRVKFTAISATHFAELGGVVRHE